MADKGVDIKVKTTQEGGGVLDRVVKGLQDVKTSGGAAAKAIEGFAGLIKGPFAAAAAVAGSVAAAFAGVTRALNEFANAQESVAKLDAALAQQGLLSGEFRERLQELAGELQRATAIADDEWLDVLTRLVQFGSDQKSIGMDVEAVKNLAGIVGNITTAANLYSRALQGNFEMFARYGIVVKDAGTQTEKLRELQEQLAQRGGGQLEARAKTLNGQYQALKNSTSDLLEALGQQIAKTGILQGALGLLTNAAEWWAETLGDTVDQLDGLTNATADASMSVEDYKRQLEGVATLSEKIKAALDAETDSIKRKQQAMDEVADAQMALDLARVDEEVRSGRISEVEGLRAKHGIRSAAAEEKFSRAQAADQATLAAQEQAFSDLVKLESDVKKRKATLEKELREGGPKERAARLAAERATDIRAEIASVERQGGGTEIKEQRLSELRAMLAVTERIGPKSLEAQRNELAALSEREAALTPKVEAARTALVTSDLPARLATREQVFGLQKQTQDIAAGGQIADAQQKAASSQLNAIEQGAAGISGGAGEALASIERSNEAVLAAMARLQEAAARQEARVRQLETQARNQLNQ